MGRAQITVEFLIIFTMLALLSLALVKFYIGLSEDASAMAAMQSSRSTALALAAAIDRVSQAGDGASAALQLPDRLSTGATYTLSVYGSLRRIEVVSAARAGAMSVAVPITTDRLEGEMQLWGGVLVTLKNAEGVVFVSA